MPALLFRTSHPWVAVTLAVVAALATIGLNTLIGLPVPWLLSGAIGFAAWFLNLILVYRSRYLKSNYLYGWLWYVAVFALCSGPQGVQWETLWGSLAAAMWMASAYEMSVDERSTLSRRINLGFVSGLLLIWDARFASLLVVSCWIIGWGTNRSGRGILQLLTGWLVPVISIATFRWTLMGPESFNSWLAPIRPNWTWSIPSPGESVLLFWLILAIPETMRATTSAKLLKRQGLYLSWLGILFVIAWRAAYPGSSMSGFMAVFAAPQLLNLQDYLPKPWMRVVLGPSLIAAGLVSAVLS